MGDAVLVVDNEGRAVRTNAAYDELVQAIAAPFEPLTPMAALYLSRRDRNGESRRARPSGKSSPSRRPTAAGAGSRQPAGRLLARRGFGRAGHQGHH